MKLISYDRFFREVSLLYPCELCFYFLVERLEAHCVGLDSAEFFLN
jgi:hypothetical protein